MDEGDNVVAIVGPFLEQAIIMISVAARGCAAHVAGHIVRVVACVALFVLLPALPVLDMTCGTEGHHQIMLLVGNEALLRKTTCVLSAAARRMFNIMLALLT